jgi:SAM-dependent methyltransferase
VAVPVVGILGEALTGGGVVASLVLATVGFVVPATILSAVGPMLVRATIRDLASSGRLVGRLSAIGTVGAITGTFLTGFVLLGAVPTRLLVAGTGGILVLVGLLVAWRFGGSRAGIATLLAAAVGSTLIAAAAPSPCERESPYYCIAVHEEPGDATRRTLILDNLRHSFVDTDDPTAIGFAYIRWFAAATADLVPAGASTAAAGPGPTPASTGLDAERGLDAVHIGGGGFAFPRYLRAVAPESRHVVLELDPVVLDVARRELGFLPDPAIDVRLGDARGTLRGVPAEATDLVVGDAFGGLSVPWHLTTREFMAEIDRILRPDGRYVANLIDGPELRLVRAEVATLLERFDHVAVATWRDAFRGTSGGNVVVVASHVPLDVAALRARVVAGDRDATVIGGNDVAAFASGAPVLRDDFAPADQLLGR